MLLLLPVLVGYTASGGCGDVTVTGVMVNHGKIPDSEGYSFNYHGNHRGP